MRRQLVLVRHTKSSWKELGLTDFDRPLKKDRKEDAIKMGKYLSSLKLKPDAIISSPALRTRQTAELLCQNLRFQPTELIFDKRIYESTAEEVLQVIRETDESVQTLVVVGHNPSLTYLVNMLVPNSIEELPTTGVAWLEIECHNWEIYTTNNVVLRYFISPKTM